MPVFHASLIQILRRFLHLHQVSPLNFYSSSLTVTGRAGELISVEDNVDEIDPWFALLAQAFANIDDGSISGGEINPQPLEIITISGTSSFLFYFR